MSDITFKCPNCGSYLVFEPSNQQWKCPFCESIFEEKALLERDAEMTKEAQREVNQSTQVVYHCQNCGSQIMTDDTTVATECYYCHSPVVLQGKMTDDLRPEEVLPFSIDKQAAVDRFMAWIKNKRYIPSDFFKRGIVEQMYGVYYPHFVSECEMKGVIDGEGRNVHIVDEPKYITTVTEHFHVRREGFLRFRNILRPALTKTNKKITDGIHPFPLEKSKPFAGAFLSGFLAERRDIDKDAIEDSLSDELKQYVQPMLSETVHYEQISLSSSGNLTKVKTKYVMLPTWVLTYPNPQKPEDPYYYAMNGCTGKVCGKLPLSRKKLWLTGLLVGLAVFVVGCVCSYFLW